MRFPAENKFYNLQVDLDSKITELIEELRNHLGYNNQETIQLSIDQN